MHNGDDPGGMGRLDRIEGSLSTLQSDISALTANVGQLVKITEHQGSQIVSLQQQYRESGRTNWGVVISAMGVLVVVVGLAATLVGFAINSQGALFKARDDAADRQTLILAQTIETLRERVADHEGRERLVAEKLGILATDVKENVNELGHVWDHILGSDGFLAWRGSVEARLQHVYEEQKARTGRVYEAP